MKRVIAIAKAFALTLALVLPTFVVLSFFSGLVPVGKGLELWSMDSEGWILVVPEHGLARERLATGVSRLGENDGGFVVEQSDGNTVVVSEEGGSWHVRPASTDDLGSLRAALRRPGELKARLVMVEFWWLFLIETVVASAIVVFAAPAIAKRRALVP